MGPQQAVVAPAIATGRASMQAAPCTTCVSALCPASARAQRSPPAACPRRRLVIRPASCICFHCLPSSRARQPAICAGCRRNGMEGRNMEWNGSDPCATVVSDQRRAWRGHGRGGQPGKTRGKSVAGVVSCRVYVWLVQHSHLRVQQAAKVGKAPYRHSPSQNDHHAAAQGGTSGPCCRAPQHLTVAPAGAAQRIVRGHWLAHQAPEPSRFAGRAPLKRPAQLAWATPGRWGWVTSVAQVMPTLCKPGPPPPITLRMSTRSGCCGTGTG